MWVIIKVIFFAFLPKQEGKLSRDKVSMLVHAVLIEKDYSTFDFVHFHVQYFCFIVH